MCWSARMCFRRVVLPQVSQTNSCSTTTGEYSTSWDHTHSIGFAQSGQIGASRFSTDFLILSTMFTSLLSEKCTNSLHFGKTGEVQDLGFCFSHGRSGFPG